MAGRESKPAAFITDIRFAEPFIQFRPAAAKDRKTNKVRAKVTKKTDAKTLQKFVADSAAEGATVSLHRINLAYPVITHTHYM